MSGSLRRLRRRVTIALTGRHHESPTVLALAAFFLVAGYVGSPAAVFAAPPNVVILLSDDQAWTDYGFMGHPHDSDAASRSTGQAERRLHARLHAHEPLPLELDDDHLRPVSASASHYRQRSAQRNRSPRNAAAYSPHADAAEAAGRAGLCQLPKRQMVGRELCRRRIYGGHDAR